MVLVLCFRMLWMVKIQQSALSCQKRQGEHQQLIGDPFIPSSDPQTLEFLCPFFYFPRDSPCLVLVFAPQGYPGPHVILISLTGNLRSQKMAETVSPLPNIHFLCISYQNPSFLGRQQYT